MTPDLNKLRGIALPFLTKTAHYSAPFITTFLLIHLTSPAIANLGGSSLASQTMLLGREYYQTSLSEPLLILTPIAVHTASATLKRLLSAPGRPPRRLTHILSMTGYASMLFFLPVHYLTHRAYPALETPPIYGIGPAELDYEFVKVGLKVWPIRSMLLYGGLVLSTTVHMVDGITIIWNTNLKDAIPSFRLKSWKKSDRSRRMALILGGVALPVLAGLFALTKEPILVFKSLASRYEAVFLSSFMYRF